MTFETPRHRDTEIVEQVSGSSPHYQTDYLTRKIIGLAIEVHRELGPGLLESAYEQCLCHELSQNKVSYVRQKSLPVQYKEIFLDTAYRVDLVVADQVIIELKTVEKILPIHQAQLLTYLRLSGLHTGLLMNFNSAVLKDGIKRISL